MDYKMQQKTWEDRGEKCGSYLTRHPIWSIILFVLIVSIGGIFAKIVLFPIWFASAAFDVVKKEVAPAELLRKYEWFKNASAELDKKQADIKFLQSELVYPTGVGMLFIWEGV